ncbi:MAG: hypothetical protein ACJAWL_003596 [Motiliproteus sp.]|jgi:hypothetical protein
MAPVCAARRFRAKLGGCQKQAQENTRSRGYVPACIEECLFSYAVHPFCKKILLFTRFCGLRGLSFRSARLKYLSDPYLLGDQSIVDGFERETLAGALNAEAGLYGEQGTMRRTLNKLALKIQKLVGQPLQGDAPVGTAVTVEVQLPLAFNRDQGLLAPGEALALALGNGIYVAELMHMSLTLKANLGARKRESEAGSSVGWDAIPATR